MYLKNAVCKKCGNNFEYEHIHQKGRIKKYCSLECMATAHASICAQCGASYQGTKASRFCSKKCAGASKHDATKAKKCVTCLREYKPKKGDSQKYCKECRPVSLSNCLWCRCEIKSNNNRPQKYCCIGCKQMAARKRSVDRNAMIRQQTRRTTAKAVRLWRQGLSKKEIAAAIGRKESAVTGWLHNSKGYRRISKARLEKSKWQEKERLNKSSSALFVYEHEFRDYAAVEMKKLFNRVETEVNIPNSLRRIDIVITDGLWRFGLEMKNGNRTARMDQTLGQAIVKCHALGGLIPVCCYPDDIVADKVFLSGCRSVGVIAGTMTDCINEMLAKCCKQATYNKQKVL
jgi:transposase